MIVTVLLGAAIGWIAWCLVALHHNIQLARSTGLPYFIWFYHETWFTFAITPAVSGIYFRLLPSRLKDEALFMSGSTRHQVKTRIHDKYGPVVVVVSPGGLDVIVADAEATAQITLGRDFPKRAKEYVTLEVYGKNVITTEGKEWTRHRKFTTGPFNERNSSLVWRVSISRATEMLQVWASESSNLSESANKILVPDYQHYIRSLALFVISSAGFGVNLSFSGGASSPTNTKTSSSADTVDDDDAFFSDEKAPPGFTSTYRRALQTLTTSLPLVILVSQFPDSLIKKAPAALRRMLETREEVREYLLKLISNERKKRASASPANPAIDSRRHNLLSMLVGNEDAGEARSQKSRDMPLTIDEIIANIFIFTIAGHETTANTLGLALALLAINDDAQAWLHRELDSELQGESEDPAEWEYGLFAKLKAPLCVMFETMRIIAPVPIIPRSTGLSPTTLVVNGVSHTIPPDTSVALNPLGLHYNKSYWGPDADTYDPSRWDPSNSSSFLQQFSDPAGEDEKGGGEVMPKLLKPKRCTWIPFSEGYRGCLGKKFAEVEFVAVLTVLLRRKKVSILRLEGETEEMARARAQNLVDSCTNLTALNVNGKIGIVLSDRE